MKITHPLLLAITISAIITSIVYLESQKVNPIQLEQNGESDSYKELVNPSGFINTDPFKISDYIGKKVILIDFWAYSCINCQRTQPYLNAWWDSYKDKGLIIIGVHTPEFEFEKDYNNVLGASKKFNINYPIVLDNDSGTWQAYGNRYWPRKYLIDLNGKIVYDHIGEGSYDETEAAIQKALGIKDEEIVSTEMPEVDLGKIHSPETYFGSLRNDALGNGTAGELGIQSLTFPEEIVANQLYLDGTWDFNEEYAETQSDTAKIAFKYDSKDVYMVGSADEEVTLEVYVDGVLVNTVKVKAEDLYTLIKGKDYGIHNLEIRVKGKGLKAFTFTFG